MAKKNKQKKKKKKKFHIPPKPKMPALPQYQKTSSWKCHKGNIELFSIELGEEKTSGKFLVGGWNRNAQIMTQSYVIDLTGSKKLQVDIEAIDDLAKKAFAKTIAADSKVSSTGILHLYIPDANTPHWPKNVWTVLASEIYNLMESGTDVLVCCLGGHGRTGIAAAILGYIIDPEMTGENPIQWVRDAYCEKVVENQKQIDYIYDVLELGKPPKKLKGSRMVVAPTKTYTQSSFHSKLSKEHENDGVACDECTQSYYCKAKCKLAIHPVYQGYKPKKDDWGQHDYHGYKGENNAEVDSQFQESAEWATYMGHSW